MDNQSIIVTKVTGRYGGPLIITPTPEKNKILYIAGGYRPAIVAKIVELTQMEAVNGFKTSIHDEQVAVAVIDCGGSLRCGLFPKKGIPPINIMPTGKSGALAEYINEEIYVSAVGLSNINALKETTQTAVKTEETTSLKEKKKPTYDTTKKLTEQPKNNKSIIAKIGMGAGKVVATFNQAARNSVQTMFTTVIPFMAFVSLLIGIIEGSGIGDLFAPFHFYLLY